MARTKFKPHEIGYSDRYRFRKTDELNWDIEEFKIVKKTGAEVWRPVSHHGTLKDAAYNLSLMVADQGESATLLKYAEDLEKICADMKDVICAQLKKTPLC